MEARKFINQQLTPEWLLFSVVVRACDCRRCPSETKQNFLARHKRMRATPPELV